MAACTRSVKTEANGWIWCRRLQDDILAGPTPVFGSAHDQNPELGRHDVEPLGDVFPDPMQLAGAARADLARHLDQPFDARQVRR